MIFKEEILLVDYIFCAFNV